MSTESTYDHAASIYSGQEMLTAFVAERLDRLADRMAYRGHERLALYGCLDHIGWLFEHIEGMRVFPLAAYIAGPDRQVTAFDELTHEGLPMIAVDHPRMSDIVDTVLIADDRYEEDMYRKAMRWLPPGIIVHRLYERLGIGRESLIRATIDRRPKAPRVIVKSSGEVVTEAIPA